MYIYIYIYIYIHASCSLALLMFVVLENCDIYLRGLVVTHYIHIYIYIYIFPQTLEVSRIWDIWYACVWSWCYIYIYMYIIHLVIYIYIYIYTRSPSLEVCRLLFYLCRTATSMWPLVCVDSPLLFATTTRQLLILYNIMAYRQCC